MNACIYARTCQQEKRHHTTAIPNQIEIGRTLAIEHSLALQDDHIFTDVEYPGHLMPTCWTLDDEDGRPALAAMIHAIEAKAVNRVIVRRIEKLGTASETLQLLLDLFKRFDVYIVAPPEVANESPDPSAAFAYSILQERIQIETEASRERIEKAKAKKREEISRLQAKISRLEAEIASL